MTIEMPTAGRTTGKGMLASSPRVVPFLWPGLAFGTALALALIVLMLVGNDGDGIHAALLATARLAFPPFWLAYAGGALAALFGPAFDPLRRHARELGLAFAAALSVHLGLVASLYIIGDPPPVKTLILFGIAAACVYLMALFSISRLQRLLGAKVWSLLFFAGMNYVALAFAADFLHDPFAGGMRHALMYWPFAVLAVIGPTLRIAATGAALRARIKA